MKSLAKLLCLAVLLVAPAAIAKADPITGSLSTTGANTFDQTQITFTPSTEPVLLATGTMAPYLPGTAVLGSFHFDSSAIGTVIFSVSKVISGIPSMLSFTINSAPMLVAGAGSSATNGSFAVVMGTGIFKETGYADTAGTFSLSTTTTGTTSFNFNSTAGTPAVTPEPSSLILLGTGLVSAAGMVLRRRRTV